MKYDEGGLGADMSHVRCGLLAFFVACGPAPAAPPPTPAPPAAQPGHWDAGVPFAQPCFEGYAATLGGKIYYFGGIVQDAQGSPTPSGRVSVFDPALGTWADAGLLPANGPMHHLAIAVDGARLYMLGGFTGIIGAPGASGFHPNATTFSFDGASFTRLADQPVARGAATAQAIGGKIYVAGGGNDDISTRADLYAYDPASDTWTKLAFMPTSREHVASCTAGNKMIVGGGWNGPNKSALTNVEVYDPATDAWSTLPGLPTARGGLGGIELGGTCYFIGGERWDIALPGTYHVNEGVDPTTGTWQTFAPMPTARHGIGVAVLGGSIFVVGGGTSQGNSYTSAVEVFTP